MKKIKAIPVIVTVMLMDIENVIPYHPPWFVVHFKEDDTTEIELLTSRLLYEGA
jgi:hypothetical protein